MLTWIVQNPSAFASLASATIAASVALLVFALTQFITHKKQRTQFLLPKLEALYLLLNEVSEANVTFFKLAALSLKGDKLAQETLSKTEDLDLYGHRTAKKIIMHVRLYFPELSIIHQHLFGAQRELNELFAALHTTDPPDLEDVVMAAGMVGHFARLMEREMILNRDVLLKDTFFPRKYRRSSPEEIESPEPRPDAPIFAEGT